MRLAATSRLAVSSRRVGRLASCPSIREAPSRAPTLTPSSLSTISSCSSSSSSSSSSYSSCSSAARVAASPLRVQTYTTFTSTREPIAPGNGSAEGPDLIPVPRSGPPSSDSPGSLASVVSPCSASSSPHKYIKVSATATAAGTNFDMPIATPLSSEDDAIIDAMPARPAKDGPRRAVAGSPILRDPLRNKGLSFTPDERLSHGLTGLLPHTMESLEMQCARAMKVIQTRQTPIDKYLYLASVKAHNTDLFFRLLMDNIRELMPLVYTPTIGDVCLQYSSLYTRPEALYISIKQRGAIRDMLRNWPGPDPQIAVVTDGSRILGLGDLGLNGVGISIGKLALYTAAAGIPPDRTLPVVLDCGTDNDALLQDPFYLGLRQRRVSVQDQQAFMDDFMDAVKDVYPEMLVQFEDFESGKAFRYLDRYRDSHRAFNDDIQGTGAVVLGGYIGAVDLSGVPLEEQRLVFMGAGSAGVGVAKQLVEYYTRRGLSEDEARRKFFLVDTKGLVTLDRGDALAEHKTYFARSDNNGVQLATLQQVIEYARPSALVGLAATHGVFTEPVVRALQASVDAGGSGRRPILFPLSNPLTKAECTFEQAVRWTDGAAIFASGSPFSPFAGPDAVTHYPNQGNNVYVFPGLGLGAILAKATRVTDEMVYTAAAALAASLTAHERARGLIYPAIDRVREASLCVAAEVMKAARRDGVAELPGSLWAEWEEWGDVAMMSYIKRNVYEPVCFADAKGRL